MKVVKGDITKVTDGVVVHQVNCMGVMGAGVSKSIREAHPAVFDEYESLCRKLDPRGLFGCVQFVTVSDGLEVANSFSQFRFGDPRKTGDVFTDARTLIANIKYVSEMRPGRKVYIPYGIGCGLGGGDWNVVSHALVEVPVIAVRMSK